MQTTMIGLKSVSGVMGSMLSDEKGNVLTHSFPPIFDQSTLNEVAVLINDNSLGLQEVTGGVKLFDIRTGLGRIIVKPLPRMVITVLCETTINVQLLSISLNVVAKKLEKFSDEQMAALVKMPEAPAPAIKPDVVKAAAPVPPVKKHWLERMQDNLESKIK